jgi:glutathione S-transferase
MQYLNPDPLPSPFSCFTVSKVRAPTLLNHRTLYIADELNKLSSLEMDSLKPITLYSHIAGPNPWKVAVILEELGVPYETKFLPFPEMKQPAFELICVNGRVPAIEDPNTKITLWESGAIVEYLIETYDKEGKLRFAAGTPEYFYAKQWLHFQMSGQGPYFGQAVWFTYLHPEKLPSAQKRYFDEIRRVSGVVSKHLETREWLVGDKCSYADIAFLPWFDLVSRRFKDTVDILQEFPVLDAWLSKIKSRPAASNTLAAWASARDSQQN